MLFHKKHKNNPEHYYGARKRLFIGLITGTSVFLCLILLAGWIIPFIGFSQIHPSLPYVFGLLFGAAILFICWTTLGLVLQILKGRAVLGTSKMRGMTIRIFLPLMTMFARLIGIDKRRVRQSFIRVNNELVRSENGKFEAKDILILTPHCLQSSTCDLRLSYNVDNCKRCGKCPVAMLLRLRDHYGVKFAIATGGTIARRIVVNARPKFIVAVACERDLTSGIQDTYPLPVYGVLNERPCGPCLDTLVPELSMERALRMFIKDPAPPLQFEAAFGNDDTRC